VPVSGDRARNIFQDRLLLLPASRPRHAMLCPYKLNQQTKMSPAVGDKEAAANELLLYNPHLCGVEVQPTHPLKQYSSESKTSPSIPVDTLDYQSTILPTKDVTTKLSDLSLAVKTHTEQRSRNIKVTPQNSIMERPTLHLHAHGPLLPVHRNY
jgi:hypothetical protein